MCNIETALTGTEDTRQQRDAMTPDIRDVFAQTEISEKEMGYRVVMKIRGPLIDIIMETDPAIWNDDFIPSILQGVQGRH